MGYYYHKKTIRRSVPPSPAASGGTSLRYFRHSSSGGGSTPQITHSVKTHDGAPQLKRWENVVGDSMSAVCHNLLQFWNLCLVVIIIVHGLIKCYFIEIIAGYFVTNFA